MAEVIRLPTASRLVRISAAVERARGAIISTDEDADTYYRQELRLMLDVILDEPKVCEVLERALSFYNDRSIHADSRSEKVYAMVQVLGEGA